jgi:hypothetical protein
MRLHRVSEYKWQAAIKVLMGCGGWSALKPREQVQLAKLLKGPYAHGMPSVLAERALRETGWRVGFHS